MYKAMYAVNMLYWPWLINKAVFGQWLGTIEIVRKYKLNTERKKVDLMRSNVTIFKRQMLPLEATSTLLISHSQVAIQINRNILI